MYVYIDRAGGDNELLARDDLGRGTDDELRVHAFHNVRISRLAYCVDAPILHADVRLHTQQDFSPVALSDARRRTHLVYA